MERAHAMHPGQDHRRGWCLAYDRFMQDLLSDSCQCPVPMALGVLDVYTGQWWHLPVGRSLAGPPGSIWIIRRICVGAEGVMTLVKGLMKIPDVSLQVDFTEATSLEQEMGELPVNQVTR